MPRNPRISSGNVQPCDLYENDSVLYKFECYLSGDCQRVATSSYSNLFCVFGCSPRRPEARTLEESKNPVSRTDGRSETPGTDVLTPLTVSYSSHISWFGKTHCW
ncbi:serine/threonine protein phosphatase 2A 55 kDa regulatory subunit B beta isoform-like isoform X2 [Andrographis paniculata]|uniref:serine/threonine protein phosphatase 2A 55 kDa regulatory subunit B beta isoform-like isoform X2 n=1 Tax=Andrographis paniculata TaxID=175694 RepID=UPI0021E83220|nr:serine/threonine protein phosphatase 2A 55 kDa regulatory subunit B beta isoform-like isoform X2 [Andrographis paniculata]